MSKKKELPFVTRKEVAKHKTEEDCWIIVNDKVYSIPNSWINIHPGGKLTIKSMAGKDATEPFIGFHDQWIIEKKIQAYHIANLKPEEMNIDRCILDFRALEKDLRKKGYFQTDYYWYGRLALWLTCLFFLGLYCLIYGESLFAHIIASISFGLYMHQLAFLGHDLCHNAVTHNRFYDTLIAETIVFMVGICCQWWKKTHNVHHIVTNSVEFDPDIQHLPILAVTEKYFKNVYSLFHGRVMYFDNIAKFFVARQYYFYYPVMLVSRFNLHLQGIIMHLKSKEIIPFRLYDLTSLLGYFVFYYAFLLPLLPTFERKLMFFLITHALQGLLAVQITISHFAMPVFEGITSEDYNYNFVKIQFESAMDVDCPEWLDWLHGGLQFQVVHHLFPRIPRHHLREVRDKFIIPFAKKWNFKYHSYTFIDANVKVLEALKNASQQLYK